MEQDHLSQVLQASRNFPKDGPLRGPIIFREEFTAEARIHGRPLKVITEGQLPGKDWVFKDETGLPSMQPYNIMPKIIPDLVWDKTLPFPLNNTWGYHDACTGNGHWDLYYREMVKRYGESETMERLL